jgi:hypothetical protein
VDRAGALQRNGCGDGTKGAFTEYGSAFHHCGFLGLGF